MKYIISTNAITVYFDSKGPKTLYRDNPRFNELQKAVLDNDEPAALKCYCPLADTQNTTPDLKIEDGFFVFKGQRINNALTRRILEATNTGIDTKPLETFLRNVLENPNSRAVNELYGFLERNNLPITEDGYFIAYKKVRNDYTDCYSGTIDNSVGQKPSMPRNAVNDDCTQTCSHGLHVCSLEYLAHFSGDRLMACKVNPANVVSVPVDYGFSKMRVSEYEVIDELDPDVIEAQDAAWTSFTRATPDARTLADKEGEEDEEDFENALECSPEKLLDLVRRHRDLTPKVIANTFHLHPNESIPLVFASLDAEPTHNAPPTQAPPNIKSDNTMGYTHEQLLYILHQYHDLTPEDISNIFWLHPNQSVPFVFATL